MITDSILYEINDDEKFIEVQTLQSENFEKFLRLIEKTRKRIANANINLIIEQNNKVNNFLNVRSTSSITR